MRTVKDIKAEIRRSQTYNPNLWVELYETLLHGVSIERVQEIMDAERDGRVLLLPNRTYCSASSKTEHE